jgi:hypothetical protein
MLSNQYTDLVSDAEDLRNKLADLTIEIEFAKFHEELSSFGRKIQEAQLNNFITVEEAYLLKGQINDLEYQISDDYKPGQTKSHRCVIV